MTSRTLSLLENLISTPSPSREEGETANILETFLQEAGIETKRIVNNVWAVSENFDPARPTLLLNSHHDTVRPVAGWIRNPYSPERSDGRIYGLGSNDAGGSVVALTETFINLQNSHLNVNLLLALSAEEEVSGKNGIELLLNHFNHIGMQPDMAIVGEPTGMKAAIAERGLLVLDAAALGKSGHAARNEGVNALYKALDDIEKLRNFKFEKRSPALGDIKITVTMISAGTQHNVVPDRCEFVVDVRTTDAYTNVETVELLKSSLESEITPRSTRLNASVISSSHPLVKGAVALGAETFISPTLSDRALMHGLPALKIGPGDSARSHTADEYIFQTEIEEAIDFYTRLITSL